MNYLLTLERAVDRLASFLGCGIAVDAGLHSDEKNLLLENGPMRKNLWGINIYSEFDRSSVGRTSLNNIGFSVF